MCYLLAGVVVSGSFGDGDLAPEIAYYYPEPYWHSFEVDQLKSLLLFFDRIAILLPSYMAGREVAVDPILAGPLKERGLLQVLQPEEFVDQETTEALTGILLELLERGAFNNLNRFDRFVQIATARLGWSANQFLAGHVIEELRRQGLGDPITNRQSVRIHPTVRTLTLVLLSQLARRAGRRRGLDLHPVTTNWSVIDTLLAALSLPEMPSQGHIVTLDLETVGLNLAAQPLDEILDFRRQHGREYRDYARQVRQLVAQLSVLPQAEREQIVLDRREELADRAHDLRRTALRAWRRPVATVAIAAAGAAWPAAHGDLIGAALTFAGTAIGASLVKPSAGAYSYLFRAQRELSRAVS